MNKLNLKFELTQKNLDEKSAALVKLQGEYNQVMTDNQNMYKDLMAARAEIKRLNELNEKTLAEMKEMQTKLQKEINEKNQTIIELQMLLKKSQTGEAQSSKDNQALVIEIKTLKEQIIILKRDLETSQKKNADLSAEI